MTEKPERPAAAPNGLPGAAAVPDATPCSLLRSKKYFFLPHAPRSVDDLLDGSSALWCGQTQQAVGPDNGLVTAEHCRAGRRCFRGWSSPA